LTKQAREGGRATLAGHAVTAKQSSMQYLLPFLQLMHAIRHVPHEPTTCLQPLRRTPASSPQCAILSAISHVDLPGPPIARGSRTRSTQWQPYLDI